MTPGPFFAPTEHRTPEPGWNTRDPLEFLILGPFARWRAGLEAAQQAKTAWVQECDQLKDGGGMGKASHFGCCVTEATHRF